MLFLEVIKFYLIFRYAAKIKIRKNYAICFFISLSGLGLYIYLITYIMEENIISYLIFVLIELIVVFDYSFYKLILLEFGVVGLIGSMDGLSLIGFKIFRIVFQLDWGKNADYMLCNIGTILFIIILYYTTWRNQNISLLEIGFLSLFYIFIIGFIYSFLLVFIWDIMMEGKELKYSVKYYIIYLLMIAGAYYQMGLLLKLSVLNHKLKEKDNRNQHYLQLQEQQYHYIQSKEKETRKIRHDMKQHIFIIMQYCKNKNIEEIEQYIEQIWGNIEKISVGYCLNHSILDAILNQYAYLCKENGIKLKVTGYLPEQCEISSYDLCVLFSNLIENAYEATLYCENGFIEIALRFDEQIIYIQEKNSYNKKIRKENGQFITRKDDRKAHGFGIDNIRETVKKYRGTFEFQEELIGNERIAIIQIMVQNRKVKV